MDITEWWQTIADKGGEFALQYGLRIVGVIVVFLVGRWVAAAFGRGVRKVMTKRKVDEVLVQFASNLVRYAMLVFVALICLELFGIETMSFVAVLGAAGLAIGLALQGTLAHFAAGVMLVLNRPFKLGDVIDAADVVGAVERLGLFSTTLVTPDNKTITVPNGKIWGSTIKNLSDRPTRRVEVEVGISYEADLDRAQETMVKALRVLPSVLANPAPEAYLKGFGPSSIDFELRCYCAPADYWAVREQMIRACKKALDLARITIPYPQMALHFEGQDLPMFAGKQAPIPQPAKPA